VGELLHGVAGNEVATAATARAWFDTFAPGSVVAVSLGAGGERTVELRMATTPAVVAPNEPDRLYTVVWGMTAAAVGRMDAQVPTWLAQLNQAAVLLHARHWQGAAELLRTVQAPAGAGLGQGLVQYWLGVALAELGETEAARAAFEQALQHEGARYLSDDGPWLAPMVRARLGGLEGGS
jgi:hypothetical protein